MKHELVKVKRTIVELAWCRRYENGELEYLQQLNEIEVLLEEVVE